MYCKNCGRQIQIPPICPACGCNNSENPTIADEFTKNNIPYPTNPEKNNSIYPDNNKSCYGILIASFIFPIVGIVLYFVWQDQCPQKARSAGKAALCAVIIKCVLTLTAYFAMFSYIITTSASI